MRDYLISRLREPSTWRGIILLAAALGLSIRPDLAEAIVALGLALAGGVAVATPDRMPERMRDELPVAYPEAPGPPPDYTRRTGREDLDRWES